ncbi:MAG: hypothetical protein NZ958_05560 [Bacteroidia bacterium]|nr:hypothetical protein [Bacteroidia bacterium]MDW8088953.1 hypothetical protein [Bacteroidia bacterium]
MILTGYLVWLQSALSMGARVQLMNSHIACPTDKTSPLVSFSPTYTAGVTGFLSWGWQPFLRAGIELGYQGVGQKYYGLGLSGRDYSAEINLHYLRVGLAFQPQYQREGKNWGLWMSFCPSVTFLTQADMILQGDSVSPGNAIAPQVIQTVLAYLDRSTRPEDRLILQRMYQPVGGSLHVAAGLRFRLVPQVWILALLSYEISLGDIEKKSFRLGGEGAPLYSSNRKPAFYQLIGLQLGLQYEVFLRH